MHTIWTMETNADILKRFRGLAGLTQKELGDIVGIADSTIAGYEIGSRLSEEKLGVLIAACREHARKCAEEIGILKGGRCQRQPEKNG